MTQEEILEGNKLIAEFMKPASYDKRRKDYPFPFPVIEIVPAEKSWVMGVFLKVKLNIFQVSLI